MMKLRKSDARGHTQIDWLDSRHSFSFGQYEAPEHMGFRALRVINDDRVAPGQGFGTHGHRDMEILTYVLSGALAHKDSLGTGSTILRGDVQVMSAGTGIRHSEFNPSAAEPVHFLQIWFLPDRSGLAPRYEQKRVAVVAEPGRLHLIGSKDGRDGSVVIHQDVALYAGRLRAGDAAELALDAGRHAWVHVVEGSVTLNGIALNEGDAAALDAPVKLALTAAGESEVLVFDLA